MNNYYMITNIKPERLNDVEREHAGNITKREFINGTFWLTIRRPEPMPILLDYVGCFPVFLND